MSDLYNTIHSLHLHNLSDTDSEGTNDDRSESSTECVEMGEKLEKSGRLPLPLGNTTIESPTNFIVNTDARNGISAGRYTESVQTNENDVRNGSFGLKTQSANSRSVAFNVHQEKTAKCDSQLSTSPQRKLPILNAAPHTNPNLKGILIKPKRILPAQPDHLKAKSAQIRPSAKSYDKPDQGLSLAGDVVSPEQTPRSDSEENQTSKSPIDVDKIKSYFGKHGAELNKSKLKTTDDSNLSPEIDNKTEALVPNRSQSECGQIQDGYLIGEEAVYDLKITEDTPDVQEWNNSCDKEEGKTKMASETSATRSVRSPSPKSNTTWDRSSSGYSSDERPDPRSPPPVSSAGTSSKHSLDNEDEILTPEIDNAVANLTVSENQTVYTHSAGIQNKDNSQLDISAIDRDTLLPDNCSHTVTYGLSQTPQPTKCNTCDIMSKNKTDLSLQTHSSAFESVTPGARQLPVHKPAWTLPTKIQYRKSVSDAAISLRHPARQAVPDSHGGLEVLGISCRQQTNVSAPNSNEEGETGGRSEIPTPGSSNSVGDGATDLDLTLGLNQTEGTCQEAGKTRLIKQQLMTLRSPRDMKAMNMNVGLSTPRDDKDIRKSLHDLNSPKRRSPAMKAMPIRARHPIHVTPPNVPISDGVTKATDSDAKQGIKFFGKKMWRAPSGSPDGPENRPFSPFGGTLPPAKINEKKKKVQEFSI